MTAVFLTLAVAVAAPATKDAKKDAKKDAPTLVGEWDVESAAVGTKQENPPPGTTWTFAADGKSVLAIGGKERNESTYTTDVKKNPAWIDIAAGPKGSPLRGIYRLDGDTMTFCLVEKDAERPTAFESPAGSNAILITLKRAKKKD